MDNMMTVLCEEAAGSENTEGSGVPSKASSSGQRDESEWELGLNEESGPASAQTQNKV